jgi:hypothetical protein
MSISTTPPRRVTKRRLSPGPRTIEVRDRFTAEDLGNEWPSKKLCHALHRDWLQRVASWRPLTVAVSSCLSVPSGSQESHAVSSSSSSSQASVISVPVSPLDPHTDFLSESPFPDRDPRGHESPLHCLIRIKPSSPIADVSSSSDEEPISCMTVKDLPLTICPQTIRTQTIPFADSNKMEVTPTNPTSP